MNHVDLETLIEDLANRLDAPAVLEDHQQRMIVYSAHSDPIDEVRRDSILRRETKPTVREWFRRHGIAHAAGPVRIPGDRAAGVLGRLCVPVRYLDRLLGFLWLIDDAGRLGEEETGIAEQAGGQAALILYQEELTRRLSSTALAHLLSPSAELREASARQLADEPMFASSSPYAVVVVAPSGPDRTDAQPCISEALWDVARGSDPSHHMHLALADNGVLLVRTRSLLDDSRAVDVAREAREAMCRRLGEHGAHQPVVAGVGDPQTRVIDAATSYRQARLAAKVAEVVPAMGQVRRWRDLGVFRMLAQLPSEEAAESGMDPRLATLLSAGDDPVVVTLETYLDLACDAKATAERLHLHRGTLYYRLQKAERIGGIDLRDGNDRLAVHLGFKLARFTGRLSAAVPVASGPPREDRRPSTIDT